MGNVNIPEYFISADCSFKDSEKPTQFAVGVVFAVIVVFAKSTTARSHVFCEYLHDK